VRRKAALPLVLLSLIVLGLWSLLPRGAGDAEAAARPTLRRGATGQAVREVQQRLKDWGYYGGAVDGQFGPQTEKAVRDFQSRNGLTVDGVVGPATWAALGYSGGQAASTGAQRPGVNIDLLARVVRAEAEAEPYEGKVAVAAVLLNRVADPRFPKTLEGVIYEPHAFESVSNGRIYQTPPSADDLRAARDAVNGWDPTYGAVFFWNPSKPVSSWVWTREIITQIGNHVFAR